MPPTLAPGKIAYLQIPASDPEAAAAFYAAVFGWTLRRAPSGEIHFEDGVGEVSGTWVAGRPPASHPGLLVYILVADVAATLAQIEDAGGETVTGPRPQGPGEAVATFRDPSGNVLGIGQQ